MRYCLQLLFLTCFALSDGFLMTPQGYRDKSREAVLLQCAKNHPLEAAKPFGSPSPSKSSDSQCIYKVLDSVCDMCHAFYSRVRPDLGTKCREECYENDLYRKCASVFLNEESLLGHYDQMEHLFKTTEESL